MVASFTVLLLDRSQLAEIADDVIHHLVAAGTALALVGVDRPASDYAPDFAADMVLPAGAHVERVVALVSSRTLRRVVGGDLESAIDLLRTALAHRTPTLLAVSDYPGAGVDTADWEQIASYLRETSARWLRLPMGEVGAAAQATRPPEVVDLNAALYPPFWAEPWSWETGHDQ